MKSNETKTYGSIRKIKAYGTCGVILGLAALAVATTNGVQACLLYTSPSPRDVEESRMPSSA